MNDIRFIYSNYKIDSLMTYIVTFTVTLSASTLTIAIAITETSSESTSSFLLGWICLVRHVFFNYSINKDSKIHKNDSAKSLNFLRKSDSCMV